MKTFLVTSIFCFVNVVLCDPTTIWSFNQDSETVEFEPKIPEVKSWMTCMWIKVDHFENTKEKNFTLFSYSDDNQESFRLSLDSSRIRFIANGTVLTDTKSKINDGKWNHMCYGWLSGDKWSLYVDGKWIQSGSAPKDSILKISPHGKISIGLLEPNEESLENKDSLKLLGKARDLFNIEIHTFNIFKINSEKEMLLFSDPRYGTNSNHDDDLIIPVKVKKSDVSKSASHSDECKEFKKVKHSDLKYRSNKNVANDHENDDLIIAVNEKNAKSDISSKLSDEPKCNESEKDQTSESSSAEKSKEVSDEEISAEDVNEIKIRKTRSEKSVSGAVKDDEMMLSDQPKKPIVEETLTKKTASKDEFALSDILNSGNLNKIKEFGSKYDPNFNSKIDSFFKNGGSGGNSPSSGSAGNSGGMGGLGSFGNIGSFGSGGNGLSSLASMLGGGGGGNTGGGGLGSLASVLGGNGGGNGGGLNINQFLGSDGLSSFFKKSSNKPAPNPPSSAYPTNPGYNSNPYPYNPNYPAPGSSSGNPSSYNPNYPPPNTNSGNLYPTLPKDPPPSVPYNSGGSTNKGSVGLSDIFGIRSTDKAEPHKGSNYDSISFGEIFGFGSSNKNKNPNANPNYPENNNRPSPAGGVSLKDILGFGSSKNGESKGAYAPSYGTIGGGIDRPTKTGPKSNFDEISEGLGLNIEPDPIVRNNKPIVVLNQPNQSSKSSLTESVYKPRESTPLNSQRTNFNTYSSKKPVSESSFISQTSSRQYSQRPVEEPTIQASKRLRRDLNSRGSARYEKHDGDDFQPSSTKVSLKYIKPHNINGDRTIPNYDMETEIRNLRKKKLSKKKSSNFATFEKVQEKQEQVSANESLKNKRKKRQVGLGVIMIRKRHKRNSAQEKQLMRTSSVTNPPYKEVEMSQRIINELRKIQSLQKGNGFHDVSLEPYKNKSILVLPKSNNITFINAKNMNRKREATFHNEDISSTDETTETSPNSITELYDNINSGDESQDITIVEPDSSLVRLRITRFLKMFANFFTYAVVPVTSGMFNIIKTLVSNYRTLQSKNKEEGEPGLSFFGNVNSVTESNSDAGGFSGFDFSEDLKSVNDEAESQQDEITTKKTTKITTSSSSKSAEIKANKKNESSKESKDVSSKEKSNTKASSKVNSKTNRPNSKNNKKDDNKKFSFDTSSSLGRTKADDFEFDENLIPRFRREGNVTDSKVDTELNPNLNL